MGLGNGVHSCYYCGNQNLNELIEGEYFDKALGHDSTGLVCEDINACLDRQYVGWNAFKKEAVNVH
jgi:hypothetical protein